MPFTLHPAVSASMAAIAAAVGKAPPPLPVGDVKGRRDRSLFFAEMLKTSIPDPGGVEMQDFYTNTSDGHSLLLRWFTKPSSSPGSAIVYTHGGGMIAGSVSGYETIIKKYVSQSGVPFLAVDYRLAPDVRAPVPVTDVYAGLKWLHEHAAELGVDAGRIGIMGDSAGGGITACLAHYIKLRGGPTVKKQILLCPMLDDRTLKDDPHLSFLVWTRDDNETGWGALLGDKLGSASVHVTEAAGRMTLADAKGLPPTYMDIGEVDLFRNESLQYAATLTQAGVSCEFHMLPGMPHAFELFTPQEPETQAIVAARVRQIKSI